MDLLTTLQGFLIAWFLVYFEPYQAFLSTYIKPYNPYSYINTALSCFKCNAFWITLIYSQNIFEAILASLLAFVFDRLNNQLKTYI